MQSARDLGEICASICAWYYGGVGRSRRDVKEQFVDRLTEDQLERFLRKLNMRKRDYSVELRTEEITLEFLRNSGFVKIHPSYLCQALGEVFETTVMTGFQPEGQEGWTNRTRRFSRIEAVSEWLNKHGLRAGDVSVAALSRELRSDDILVVYCSDRDLE